MPLPVWSGGIGQSISTFYSSFSVRRTTSHLPRNQFVAGRMPNLLHICNEGLLPVLRRASPYSATASTAICRRHGKYPVGRAFRAIACPQDYAVHRSRTTSFHWTWCAVCSSHIWIFSLSFWYSNLSDVNLYLSSRGIFLFSRTFNKDKLTAFIITISAHLLHYPDFNCGWV